MSSSAVQNMLQTSVRIKGFLFGKCTKTALRHLYSLNALGVDNYVKTRERVSYQFKEIGDKFKHKMNEYANNDSQMIFTEDLKNMVHLAEKNEEDLDLVEKMLLRFSKQNKEMRFGSYVFGPVVMRMYYHLNKPAEAIKIFKNPDMGGFFDQLISFQILLDLLYKNQMYAEMLDVFEIIIAKQLQGSKYPKNAVVLTLAACYKMNSQQSFEFAKKLWSSLNECGHYPMRRAGTFFAALAISQKSPDIALEVLTSMKQQSYVTIRNLKVLALSDLQRYDDILPIFRSVLEVDASMTDNKHTFAEDIVDKVSSAIASASRTDLKNEFDRIEKQLRSLNYVSKEPIDTLLCKEITVNQLQFRQPNESTYPVRNKFKSQTGRPGLRSMV